MTTKKKEKAPKRVEYGNGRGRGRGASTGAPRGRSEFRGRGRGRGASVSANGTARATAIETSSTWADNSNKSSEPLPAWATEDTAAATSVATGEAQIEPESNLEEQSNAVQEAAAVTEPKTTHTPSRPPAAATTKPKSRIIDKNSTFSWASVAKPPMVTEPVTQANKTRTKPESTNSNIPDRSIANKPTPLTEENLEAATEEQAYIPQPPTATVASLQGEPATGPSSLTGASVTPSGPPGLKSGQTQAAARGSTPVGGRRLTQNQAVVMPGSERDASTRLGVQFGSLGLGEDEVYSDKPETSNSAPVHHQQTQSHLSRQNADVDQQQQGYDNTSLPQRQEKPMDSYVAYGNSYGNHGQQPQAFGGQGHEQYAGMSNFYGHGEQSRPSSFAGQGDFYQQQSSHSLPGSQQVFGGSQAGGSQRTENTSRPTEQSSRFPESTGSPMTSISSQAPNTTASPGPGQHGGPQHSQYPMHPQQYGAPNPYAYYGYGYGYPQQQHSSYGAPMYGQPRGGYGGQTQYQAPVAHQPVGTSQDRFERSTAEYQRQQQMSQYSQGGFSNTDFLGSSRNQQPASESLDPFKGYNTQGSNASRDDVKTSASTGYSAQSPAGFSQQQQMPSGAAAGSQYGSQTGGQYGEQQQGQYSQYGSYGRAGGHQQYGGGQWNQY